MNLETETLLHLIIRRATEANSTDSGVGLGINIEPKIARYTSDNFSFPFPNKPFGAIVKVGIEVLSKRRRIAFYTDIAYNQSQLSGDFIQKPSNNGYYPIVLNIGFRIRFTKAKNVR